MQNNIVDNIRSVHMNLREFNRDHEAKTPQNAINLFKQQFCLKRKEFVQTAVFFSIGMTFLGATSTVES